MAAYKPLSVAFVHPQMIIGGAERLIVHYALALQSLGHRTEVFTTRHDPACSLLQTINGEVRVSLYRPPGWLRLFARFQRLLVYVEVLLLTLWMVLRVPRFDLYIVDQISLPVLLLRLCGRKVLFYCHFPEKAYPRTRDSLHYRICRCAMDVLEGWALGVAACVQINSQFTKRTLERCFPSVGRNAQVLYPPVLGGELEAAGRSGQELPARFFLSLNRFERPKCVTLAVEAFARYATLSGDAAAVLVVAGGLNRASRAGLDYLEELQALSTELGVEARVQFLPDISDEERASALSHALALLYTPENEHFGIVPVEAMYLRTPVLARDSGGLLESVEHGRTGFLLSGEAGAWAECMQLLAGDEGRRRAMGEAGHRRAVELFGMEAFTQQIKQTLQKII